MARVYGSQPAWESWIELVESYQEPNCRCTICKAVKVMIQQAAESTETHLMNLLANRGPEMTLANFRKTLRILDAEEKLAMLQKAFNRAGYGKELAR